MRSERKAACRAGVIADEVVRTWRMPMEARISERIHGS